MLLLPFFYAFVGKKKVQYGLLFIENRAEVHNFLFFVYVFFHRTFPHRTHQKPHLFYENGHKMDSVSNSVLDIKKTADFCATVLK